MFGWGGGGNEEASEEEASEQVARGGSKIEGRGGIRGGGGVGRGHRRREDVCWMGGAKYFFQGRNSHQGKNDKIRTTPKFALAMFIIDFVGVMRKSRGRSRKKLVWPGEDRPSSTIHGCMFVRRQFLRIAGRTSQELLETTPETRKP